MAELRQFIRRQDGQPVGIMVATTQGVGWCITHPRDRFNKHLGVQIARGRALKGTTAQVPDRYQEDVLKFHDRAARYFRYD